MGSEFHQQHMKIAACEGPFERLRRSLISALESHQRQFQGLHILEIHRCQQITLNNGEVDLDLVEPTGMDQRIDQDDVGPPGLGADRRPRTVRRDGTSHCRR